MIVSPSMVKSTIDTRLDMVERFYTDPLLAQDMRNMLEQCKDIQRSLQKLSLRRGGPSDLLDILHTIRVLNNIRERLLQAATGDHPLDGLLYQFAMSLNEHKEIKELLESYIPEDAPKQINEHGFIQPE
jgi:DNA mismatch repair ATPase MutS